MKINTISITDPCYPRRLVTIPQAPKTLYTLGVADFENTPVIAMVGSRKPTTYGINVTRKIAESLALRGVVVVSGLALGVDCIAQEAAVRAGGKTVAVLASGLDEITPHSNRELAIRILETGGGLVSENEPGTPPRKWEFLKRNRLVSGLADAVVVTEAGLKSGTMNTVSHALEQGRDVYVVPGNITSPLSAGCNKLIAQGAQPLVDIEAFVEQIAPRQESLSRKLLVATSPEEKTIIELIQSGVSDGDELATQSGLEASLFQRTMTMLELSGTISPLGANQWTV